MPANDNAPLSLGLNDRPIPAPTEAPVPAAEQLQFRRAQPVPGTAAAPGPEQPQCVACRQPIGEEYFHAQGRVVCPMCASRIQTQQQAPPHTSLGRAALYGGGAAVAGCVLYAAVTMLLHIQFALMAIVVGIMVGKAIRHASRGLGGRPQQILAVALTYFAITASYIPLIVTSYSKVQQKREQQPAGAQSAIAPTLPLTTQAPKPRLGPVGLLLAVVFTFVLAMALPFLVLMHNPVSGLLSLFIIFIGLQRAWALTGRPEILVLGPYKRADSPAVAS